MAIISKGKCGTYTSSRGVTYHFKYYGYKGEPDIECWVEKIVRSPGGYKRKCEFRPVTKELINAYEWER